MDKCTNASTCIGISSTFKHIYDVLGDKKATEWCRNNGDDIYIVDQNGNYDTVLRDIICGSSLEEDIKELLQTHGDRTECRNGLFELYEYKKEASDNLYNASMVFNIVTILDTERWGYNREGANLNSCNLVESMEIMKVVSEESTNIAIDMGLSEYTVELIAKQTAD